MKVLHIMDATGDTQVTWDTESVESVEAAMQAFAKAKAEGYSAFRIDDLEGEEGVHISGFDLEAPKIVMIPQIQGG